MSCNDQLLAQQAGKVVTSLQATGRLLAIAESCTGGWVAKLVTDIPGSSSVFDRGFVTYSNDAKQDMLAVNQSLLVEHGAVSRPVAMAMSAGALKGSHADISVAITGIAGPGGGSEDKPVGTVWISWADQDDVSATHYLFDGDREQVRRQAVAMALKGLLERIPG
jgi:nicotinamide-nucleotide amidase